MQNFAVCAAPIHEQKHLAVQRVALELPDNQAVEPIEAFSQIGRTGVRPNLDRPSRDHESALTRMAISPSSRPSTRNPVAVVTTIPMPMPSGTAPLSTTPRQRPSPSMQWPASRAEGWQPPLSPFQGGRQSTAGAMQGDVAEVASPATNTLLARKLARPPSKGEQKLAATVIPLARKLARPP